VPVIRYICLVGPALLALLFLFGHPDQQSPLTPDPARWTAMDSLRAMAHIGEPGRWKDRDARFVRTAIVSPAHAEPRDAAVQPERERPSSPPSIMNAHASMESPRTARARAPKPRKARVAARSRRVHTAIAEKPPDEFRPPSW
jgi:hypothetical protein